MMMPPPMIPQVKLVNITKPLLQTKKKIKAFVWKKIILDFENGAQVAKKDLKGLDPIWKDKVVIWKEIKESKEFSLEMIENLFEDKTKAPVTKIVDSGQINMNKVKTYFDSTKSQNIFIALSRLPRVDIMISAVDRLNDKAVS